MKIDYDIPQLVPFINWSYFYYAWQLKEPTAQQRLRKEADEVLLLLAGRYRAHALFRLFDAHGQGDDIVIDREASSEANDEASMPFLLPMLRQQSARGVCLCLADFLHPTHDRMGVFATSVDLGMETDFDRDPYQKMMAQLLADRLAEAAAECLHQEVRRHYWGYAPQEDLPVSELHQEHFVGIRPAVGYPSLPDASVNFLLDRLLDFHQIGIRLTESGAMRPHASVSGLMLAHPQARYFSVGKIGDDQLRDYARRCGLPVEVTRKFISANL